MAALNSFYGSILFLAIMTCGLVWMFSPTAGREIAKRAGYSLLLFTAANLLRPDPNSDLFIDVLQLVISFVLWIAGVFCLISPSTSSELLHLVGRILGIVLMLLTAANILW